MMNTDDTNSDEIEKIHRERIQKDLWEDLYVTCLEQINLHPEQLIWKNVSNEKVQWWIDKAIEHEFYEVAELFTKEKEKRKLNVEVPILCQCLYEIENNLPRTKFCMVPCKGQLEMRKKNRKV